MSLTDEQAQGFYQARFAEASSHQSPSRIYLGRCHYDRLIEAGWTIEPPPEPRYQTVSNRGGAHSVVDTHRDGTNVAVFYANPEWENKQRHPDAKAAAQAEADRLNRGDA